MIKAILLVYISLAECLSLSEQNDPALRNAALDMSMAREQMLSARWEYAPRVSVNALAFQSVKPLVRVDVKDVLGSSPEAIRIENAIATLAYENGFKPYFTAVGHGYSTMALALQPIYMGGRIRSGNKLAQLALDASRLQLSIAARQSHAQVEEKYFRIVSLQEKRRTLEEAKALLQSIQKDAQSAVAAGLATTTDLLQVNLKIKELQSMEVKLNGGLALAKMDLFNAIGYEYSSLDISNIVLRDTPKEDRSPREIILPQEEIPLCEESKLLEMQVRGTRLQKKMAVGEYLPQVAVGAGWTYGLYQGLGTLPRTNGLAFATVQIPITDIAKASHTSKRLEYQVQKARNDKEYLDSQLELQVKALELQMQTAWEDLKISIEAEKLSSEAEREIRADYNAGMVAISEVLQVELSLQSARENLVEAQINYKMSVRNYLRRCGKL